MNNDVDGESDRFRKGNHKSQFFLLCKRHFMYLHLCISNSGGLILYTLGIREAWKYGINVKNYI